MRVPFVPVKDGVACGTVLSGSGAGKAPCSANLFEILDTPRQGNGVGEGNGLERMAKEEWVKGEANGLRPVVIEKEMELRDAAACWPPHPAADGSRVCRCCSSSCPL